MTIYTVLSDIRALQSLINGLTDEETGETRDLTEEENRAFVGWVQENEGNFTEKFDNTCRYYKNLKAEAAVAAAERDALKDEMARLSKRAGARENEADRVRGLVWYALDALKMRKFKTALFSAGIQGSRKTAKPSPSFNPDDIPAAYLKRELSPSAVAEAVKSGALYEKEGPLNYGKLFYRDGAGGGERELKGVVYAGGSTLVIR
jgi:hypothetical protein